VHKAGGLPPTSLRESEDLKAKLLDKEIEFDSLQKQFEKAKEEIK